MKTTGSSTAMKTRLEVHEDWLDQLTCEALIEAAREKLTPDFRFTSVADGRTGVKGGLGKVGWAIEERARHHWGAIDRSWVEPIEVVRYEPGSHGYTLHYDGYWRPYSMLIYLNDVDKGHTHWPDLGISVQPRMGTMVSWRNASRDGEPIPKSRHQPLPPASEKWVAVLWAWSQPYDPDFKPQGFQKHVSLAAAWETKTNQTRDTTDPNVELEQ